MMGKVNIPWVLIWVLCFFTGMGLFYVTRGGC